MTLTGPALKTFHVKIQADFAPLVASMRAAGKSMRRSLQRMRDARPERLNAADQINVWESEGGAL